MYKFYTNTKSFLRKKNNEFMETNSKNPQKTLQIVEKFLQEFFIYHISKKFVNVKRFLKLKHYIHHITFLLANF